LWWSCSSPFLLVLLVFNRPVGIQLAENAGR
jgi:hypothetical protein